MPSEWKTVRRKIAGLAIVVMAWAATLRAAAGPQAAGPAAVEQTGGGVETNVPPDERMVSLSAKAMPLRDALAEVCRQAKVELEFEEGSAEAAGLWSNTPVTVELKDWPLGDALERILLVKRKPATQQNGETTAFVALGDSGGSSFFQQFHHEMRGGKVFVSGVKVANALSVQGSVQRQGNMPDWLKQMVSNRWTGPLDDDGNVVSILSGNYADDAFIAKLATLPKLRELCLYIPVNLPGHGEITAAGFARLAEYPALEKLNLMFVANLPNNAGDMALRAAGRIKTLRVLRTSSSEATDEGIAGLAGMTQLTSLSLNYSHITDASLGVLAGLTNLTNLELIASRARGTRAEITDAGIRQMARLTGVRTLRLDGLNLSGTGNLFPHLESLELSGTPVRDRALEGLEQCRQLRSFKLEGTDISDEGLKRLAGLGELRSLTINSDWVTDKGVAELERLTNLSKLSLTASGISDESLRHVARMKRLTQLTVGGGRRDASAPQLNIEGVLQFTNLPHLYRLEVQSMEAPRGCLGLRALKQLRLLTMDGSFSMKEEEKLLAALMPETAVNVTRMEGIVVLLTREAAPGLSDASVLLSGRVEDDTTGQPLANCTLQFGGPDPANPGQIQWSDPAVGPILEIVGNDRRDPGRFWGETFQAGRVCARILAAGYEPFVMTPDPARSPLMAPMRLTNMVVPMRKGGDLHGEVVDYRGSPVPGCLLYLVESNMSLRFGKPTDWHKATPGMTDAGGRFALTGGKAPAPRIIAMSEDGRLFTLVSNVDAGREIPVALPEPATLVLHYDIPDDDLAAHAYLNWESAGSDPEGRHYVNIGFDAEVSNQTELVMTNLTPGSWRLSWRKSLDLVVGGGSGMGMPTSRSFLLENSTTVLEPGRTNRVDWVRPAGQSVRGEVTGIAEAEAPGAFVYAFSAHSTNSPAARVMGEVPLDGVTCGKDGQFHTARLAPGDYLIVALAYDYKQKSPSVLYNRGKGAELFGSVRVTITTNEAPPPVRIELTPAGGSGN